MDRDFDERSSVSYLWDVKRVVSFLKMDKGLASEHDRVQVMKPIPTVASLLSRAAQNGVFGTKMRSFIKLAHRSGITAIVDQQFHLANQITASGLLPIIEPEVDIRSPEKGKAEEILKRASPTAWVSSLHIMTSFWSCPCPMSTTFTPIS
jgi:fructose-bisphosphate aldolase, class I